MDEWMYSRSRSTTDSRNDGRRPIEEDVEEAGAPASIADFEAAMATGRLTSRRLVETFLARIARLDRWTRAVVELSPSAAEIASRLDAERAQGTVRGPLHGIPVLVKDNIDTADEMQTTAGSLALLGAPAAEDAGVVAGLRAAGAVILGKTNLSEWANFRSTRSSSGWSGRGGQTRNPHALDRSPSGSSSGSAVAAAAGFAAGALGTETNGSIVLPAAACGVVGVKPTVGLTSRSGVVPISSSSDTVGPIARSVADAAAILGALTLADPRDPATHVPGRRAYRDYTQFLDRDGLRGARIGVARACYFGHSEHADRVVERAIAAIREAGAFVVDPANIPTAQLLAERRSLALLYEFKWGLREYLRGRPGLAVRDLADVIAFNERFASEQMPSFGQERLVRAQGMGPLTDPEYVETLAANRRLAGEQGIDAAMNAYGLDAIVAPGGLPAQMIDPLNGERQDRAVGGLATPASFAGYPLVTVPAGFAFGLPINVTFLGSAWSEPTLIRLAYAFEQATLARRSPAFLHTLRFA